MLPYLIAGVIGYGISKLFGDNKAPKYTDGGLIAPNGKQSGLYFTEIYNQIRGIKDVIVVKVIDNDQLQAASSDLYNYSLLEMKYISQGNAIETIKGIKSEALKIPGLVKFEVRTKTILKIRNY